MHLPLAVEAPCETSISSDSEGQILARDCDVLEFPPGQNLEELWVLEIAGNVCRLGLIWGSYSSAEQ